MIIEAARKAASRMFSAEFRRVFLKTIGLTLLILVGLWFGLQQIFSALAMPYLESFWPGMPAWAGWLGLVTVIVAGIGFALLLALAIAPVTALVAGLFLDEIAELVERTDYPRDPPGSALPALQAIVLALKFVGVVILGNLVALVLLFVPGINIAAFFLVNGYLLGREFFEFAALRFRSEAEAKALRKKHGMTVFLAGLVIAGFLAVPFLNLLTPLFAAAMMVHLHKAITAQEATSSA